MGLSGTVTRADLCAEVQRAIGLSRADCGRLVEHMFDEITGALERGENVKLSSFGSFVLRDKGLRFGRNPKTGEEVPIAPRRVLTFRPSQELRERVAGAGAG